MMLHIPKKCLVLSSRVRSIVPFVLFLCLPLIISAISSTQPAHAQTVINYPSGFATAGPVVDPIGGAVLSGSAIQLTHGTSEANNVWYQDAVNVQAFTTNFTFNFVCPVDCGDGMGFMIISATNPNSPAYWSGGSGGAIFLVFLHHTQPRRYQLRCPQFHTGQVQRVQRGDRPDRSEPHRPLQRGRTASAAQPGIRHVRCRHQYGERRPDECHAGI